MDSSIDQPSHIRNHCTNFLSQAFWNEEKKQNHEKNRELPMLLVVLVQCGGKVDVERSKPEFQPRLTPVLRYPNHKSSQTTERKEEKTTNPRLNKSLKLIRVRARVILFSCLQPKQITGLLLVLCFSRTFPVPGSADAVPSGGPSSYSRVIESVRSRVDCIL